MLIIRLSLSAILQTEEDSAVTKHFNEESVQRTGLIPFRFEMHGDFGFVGLNILYVWHWQNYSNAKTFYLM